MKCDALKTHIVLQFTSHFIVEVQPVNIQRYNYIPDIPLEIVLTSAAGILVLLFVCIIALCVRWKLKGQHDVSNQAIYNQSTVSSSGGYATTKPHTRSSWTCTYKAGRQHQGDTHIWETPLPEPSADEYTLPTSMRPAHNKIPISAAMLDSMEYTMPVSSVHTQDGQTLTLAEYTKPVKGTVQRDSTDENPLLRMSLDSKKNQSQANYYYYDPANKGQTEYMANSQNEHDMGPSPAESNEPHTAIPGGCEPFEGNKECAYRTLIRLNDSSQ